MLNQANRLLALFDRDDEEHQHSLGRLMLACELIEDWMRRLIFYLGEIEHSERPFRKQGAWEDLLWDRRGTSLDDEGNCG